MDQYTFIVDDAQVGQRLDKALATLLDDYSREQCRHWIEDAHVHVNEQTVKPGYRCQSGDIIQVVIPAPEATEILPEPMDLDIVFEDEAILLLNKPAGLVVHPGMGHTTGTLVNGLLHYCPGIEQVGHPERAGIVHRLDKGTSGIILIAKQEPARRKLQQQFADRTVSKRYLAWAHGIPDPLIGDIVEPIGRHPIHRQKMAVVSDAKAAHSAYEVLRGFIGAFSSLAVDLHTGRTHQIRVHLSHRGYPLLGDKLYGGQRDSRKSLPQHLRDFLKDWDRPALHASCLSFTHPVTGEVVSYEAPLPEDLQQLNQLLKGLI